MQLFIGVFDLPVYEVLEDNNRFPLIFNNCNNIGLFSFKEGRVSYKGSKLDTGTRLVVINNLIHILNDDQPFDIKTQETVISMEISLEHTYGVNPEELMILVKEALAEILETDQDIHNVTVTDISIN